MTEKQFIESNQISLDAKGLYVFLSKLPPETNITWALISDNTKDSLTTIRLIMKELNRLKFVKSERQPDGSLKHTLNNLEIL